VSAPRALDRDARDNCARKKRERGVRFADVRIIAEYPLENRVDVLEVIVEVELSSISAGVSAGGDSGSALSSSSSDSLPSDSHTFMALRWTRR
jgi:hypothetical protein